MSAASEPGLETASPMANPGAPTDERAEPVMAVESADEEGTNDDAAGPLGSVPGGRFAVNVEGYSGTLEDLVSRANRGDIDLGSLPVSEITANFRRDLKRGGEPPDLRAIADFLMLASRLIALKAQASMPDPDAATLEEEIEIDPATDAGRRLAEYRLFRAAAEALLSDAAEEGARSFLGLVSAEVVPLERLRIPAERLAAAFRSVLERLNAADAMAIGASAFSVEEMTARLRDRLRAEGELVFEDVFASVTSRLEAVALFLGLLELLRNGEADVDQPAALGPIMVRLR